MTLWSFAASHSLMHFINRCTWTSSQYYIIISMMTSFMHMSQKLVFHQSKCICAILPILSTTAMCVSSSSFLYLRFPCYCDACLNSSALRVGLKTLLNTILFVLRYGAANHKSKRWLCCFTAVTSSSNNDTTFVIKKTVGGEFHQLKAQQSCRSVARFSLFL